MKLTIRFFPWRVWLLVACLAGSFARAAELEAAPTVEVRSGEVVVRWTTDVATGSRVYYGEAGRDLDRRADGKFSKNHEVVLKELRPDTTFYFTAGTARYPLATNSFKTLPASTLGVPPPSRTVETRAAPAPSNKTPAPAVITSAPKPKAPPTRVTWGNMGSLQDHFDRHGKDFNSKDPDDYARQAWEFLQRAKVEGLPAKRDDDGVLRVYEPKTRSFAAYHRDGTTKTFFKPGRRNYFDDQPGRPVDLTKSR